MYYVYIIKSIKFSEIVYVGSTTDIKSRLDAHNRGGSVFTKDHKPWELVWSSEFKDREKALGFERYLKSHSGKAFMQKRLL